MTLLRKLVFYLFAVIYLIVCPLTVFYVLGYALKPGHQHGMVKTGLIALASVPPGASIYLEGRRFAKRTPATMTGIYPKAYRVKVVLRGYQPWSRTIRVEAEKATVLDKILLVPNAPRIQSLLSGPFETLTKIPETPFLLVKRGSRLDDIVIFNWKDATALMLPTDQSIPADTRVVSVTAMRESSFVLLESRSKDRQQFIGMELDASGPKLTDLTNLFPMEPDWVIWNPRGPRQLFSVQRDSVNRLDLETMAIYPKIVDRIRGVGVSDQTLYVLTEDLVLQRLDQDGRLIETLFNDPVTTQALAKVSGRWRMTVLSEDLMVLLGERDELWISRFPDDVLDVGIRGFEFDPQQERLLIWRKDRVGIVECAAQASEDDVAEQNPPSSGSLRKAGISNRSSGSTMPRTSCSVTVMRCRCLPMRCWEQRGPRYCRAYESRALSCIPRIAEGCTILIGPLERSRFLSLFPAHDVSVLAAPASRT